MKKETVFPILGMAFLWPSLHVSPYYPVSIIFTTETSSSGNISAFHIIYSVIFILTLVMILIFSRRIQATLAKNRKLVFCFGFIGCIGSLLVLFCPWFGSTADIAAGVGLFFIAFYLALYIVVWGARTSQNDTPPIAFVVALSYVVYSVIWLIYYTLGFDASVILPLCPIVSALFLYLSPFTADQSYSSKVKSLKALPWEIVLPCVVFIFSAVICVRVLTGTQMGVLSSGHRIATIGIGLIIMALFTLFFYRRPYSSSVAVGGFAFLSVLYMASLLIILLFSEPMNSYDKRMLVAIEHCFGVFLWMILASITNQKRLSPFLVFSLYAIFVVALPQFISVDLMYQTGILDLVSQVIFAVPMAAIVSFIVATASIVLLVVHSSRMAQASVAQKDDWQVTLCRQATEGVGLSPRELEVVALIYRGYSAKKIADLLYLSESTIKSHTAHSYQKLDIHSKQELIGLVDRYRSEPP